LFFLADDFFQVDGEQFGFDFLVLEKKNLFFYCATIKKNLFQFKQIV